MKKYLVTGATGFLGSAVTAELLAHGAKVYALVLPDDPLSASLPEGVTAVVGDVCDEASLARFFSFSDSETFVVHCAGIVSISSQPGAKLYKVNVEGTRNIISQCFSHNVAKLVYVSSVHVIPEAPPGLVMSEPVSVSDSLVRGHYAKSKAMATSLVMDAIRNRLTASLVFPSGIIGPGDAREGSVTQMLSSFLAGKLPFAVRGGYDFVDVRDAAKGIVACAEHGKSGSGYILSGRYVSIREFLELVKKEAGLKQAVRCLPIGIAKRIAPLYERISEKKGKTPFFTPYSISVLASNGLFSHQAATAAFGYAPRPLPATLRDTLLWLRGEGSRV